MESTTKQQSPLPVGVVGCGRMGRLHARVYSQMPQVKLAGLYDANVEAAQAVAKQFGGQVFTDLTEMARQVSAVTIAVPTEAHAAVAEPFLSAAVACLIEKPLARSAQEGAKIVECGKRHGALVQVGHVERFNPAVRAIQRFKVSPRFIEVVRVSPLTFRSMDVGVVLDMMIHDIDIVLRLAQSKVTKVEAVGVSVVGQVEDICNARLTFQNGCVANLTASRLALKTERKLRIFSPEAYISLDYQKKQGIVVRRGGNLQEIRDVAAKVRSGQIADPAQVKYTDLVHTEPLEIDDVEPLRAEQDSFIAAVVNGQRPEVSGEDGLAAVELAQRIVQALGEANLRL